MSLLTLNIITEIPTLPIEYILVSASGFTTIDGGIFGQAYDQILDGGQFGEQQVVSADAGGF